METKTLVSPRPENNTFHTSNQTCHQTFPANDHIHLIIDRHGSVCLRMTRASYPRNTDLNDTQGYHNTDPIHPTVGDRAPVPCNTHFGHHTRQPCLPFFRSLYTSSSSSLDSVRLGLLRVCSPPGSSDSAWDSVLTGFRLSRCRLAGPLRGVRPRGLAFRAPATPRYDGGNVRCHLRAVG